MYPLFDKLTTICKRIFNVPIVLVSLVDVVNVWIESEVRPDIILTDKNSALDPYTVLPSSPNVFVVADALFDDRYSKSHLSIDFPNIRFYAEVPLFVEGVRVGSLCIADLKERYNFSQEDRINLLNFGLAISSLINSRRNYLMKLFSLDELKSTDEQDDTFKNSFEDNNNIMIDKITPVVKPPSNTLSNSSMKESSQLELTNHLNKDIHDTILSTNIIQNSSLQLDTTFVTANLLLEEQSIQSADNHTIDDIITNNNYIEIIPTLLTMNELLTAIQLSWSSISNLIEVIWNVDSQLTNTTITTYPEIIKHILSDLMIKVVHSYWKKANISIQFRRFRNEIFNNNNNNILSNKANIDSIINSNPTTTTNNINNYDSGYFTIKITMSQPHEITTPITTTTSSTTTTTMTTHDTNLFTDDLESIQNLLMKVGGNCSSLTSNKFTSDTKAEVVVLEFDLPGELIIPCSSNNNSSNNCNSNNQNQIIEVKNDPIPSTSHNLNLTSEGNNDDDNNDDNNLFRPTSYLSFKLKRQSSILSTFSEKSSKSSQSYSDIPRNINTMTMTMTTSTLEQQQQQQQYPSTSFYHNNNNQFDIDDTHIIKLELWDPDFEKLQIQQLQQLQVQTPQLIENCKEESDYHSKYKESLSSMKSKQRLRVLIIDNNITTCHVVRNWLQEEGCDVIIANTGKRGLLYLESKRFDVTFLDLMLPDMLGNDILQEFQNWRLESCLNNINDDMLLVGMSIHTSQREQEEAYNYDMHIFTTKPVDFDFLSIILTATSKFLSLPNIIKEITENAVQHSVPLDCTSISSKSNQKKKFRFRKSSSVSSHSSSSSSSSSSVSSSFSVTSSSRGGGAIILTKDQIIELSSTTGENINLIRSTEPITTTTATTSAKKKKKKNESDKMMSSFFPQSLSLVSRLREYCLPRLFARCVFHGHKITPHIECTAAIPVDAAILAEV